MSTWAIARAMLGGAVARGGRRPRSSRRDLRYARGLASASPGSVERLQSGERGIQAAERVRLCARGGGLRGQRALQATAAVRQMRARDRRSVAALGGVDIGLEVLGVATGVDLGLPRGGYRE